MTYAPKSTIYSRDAQTGEQMPPVTVKRSDVRKILATMRREGIRVTVVVNEGR